MVKKLAVLFLLGGGGWLIWRALTTVDRGITDGQAEQGFAGGLIDAAYGLGDDLVGAVMGSGLSGLMSVSLQGLAFMKGWEVKRLMPYHATQVEAAKGIWTIGYGHTFKSSDLVAMSKFEKGITDDEAERLFVYDVSEFEDMVSRHVKVPLTQNQFDALVSFCMNTGRLPGTTLLKLLNAGDYDGAGNQLMRWVYQGEKVLNGLYKRRSAELRIWFNNYYDSTH